MQQTSPVSHSHPLFHLLLHLSTLQKFPGDKTVVHPPLLQLSANPIDLFSQDCRNTCGEKSTRVRRGDGEENMSTNIRVSYRGGGHPGNSPPPPEKIDGNIMNVDVHYRK